MARDCSAPCADGHNQTNAFVLFSSGPVIIECPTCHARYRYDEARFGQQRSKRIRCGRCTAVFEIVSPPSEEEAAAGTLPERAPSPGQDDAEAAPLQLPAGKRLSLAIIDGPNAGTVFRVAKPRVVIGRTGADVALDDTEVSRSHAALEIRDASFQVVDLDSRNGTIVNGTRIEGPADLQDKNEFTVGGTTLMLIVTGDPTLS